MNNLSKLELIGVLCNELGLTIGKLEDKETKECRGLVISEDQEFIKSIQENETQG